MDEQTAVSAKNCCGWHIFDGIAMSMHSQENWKWEQYRTSESSACRLRRSSKDWALMMTGMNIRMLQRSDALIETHIFPSSAATFFFLLRDSSFFRIFFI